MRRVSPFALAGIIAVFLAGVLSHSLYQRWRQPPITSGVYPVGYAPLPSESGRTPASPSTAETLIRAGDIEQIRAQAGQQARVRGRVYRVARSSKSDTYFLNFGPARGAFTAVIFASTVERLARSGINPNRYEGKEIEVQGPIQDHPQYGLEMIIEDPSQIKVLN